ncbi:aminodeoxychorismate synthase component I [Actinomadura vinacea]|uniref:aminodeoxychorismate synthase component I n=1 Tax=Actinomadura vinacea TaxID=115336 RepID=UPI003CD08ADB
MKTLIIDNYDSYTYNLFQFIAEVNGAEPVVVRNDDPLCADLDPRAFDNVVVSPGPGHPAAPRDFGAATRLLAQVDIPVLGVCLGHQGIGLGEQAVVSPAPEPRHGHLSKITHTGRGLFRDLPQEFTAVRYHSLRVEEPLPATLEATAWAEDGVLMGLRHRTRPLWGVQFHPESVLTEFGHRMLANFRDLTAAWRRDEPARTVSAPRGATLSRRRNIRGITPRGPSGTGFRLHTRKIDTLVDTEAAFGRMYAGSPHAFWLDSSRAEPGQARFSFLGDGSGPLAEIVRYDVTTGMTEVERPGRPVQRTRTGVFDHLKRELARRRVDAPALPFDFTCGYVGYFGYEMKADCGSPNRHRAQTPDAGWLFADRIVAIDHREGATYLLCLAEDTEAGRRDAADWLDATVVQLSGIPPLPALGQPPPVTADSAAVEPWLVRDRERYLADIDACRRELRAGTSYEICLTNAAWLPAPYDPYDFYRALRRGNPAPYSAFLRFPGLDVACSSPERFLRVDRDGRAEARPIKGTAPRSEDPLEDAALRDALAEGDKTRAENLMIVDLLRNDLGRACVPGTVRVPRLMAAETYATVHQLVSTVRGRLRDGADALDCVRACFPGGSMTGAPKLRTLEIIDSLESEARGVYSGAIGYLSCNGAADLNIVIRTAVFTGGWMHLGAGGAIVLGSDAEEEYAEMLLKTAAPMRAYHAWIAAGGVPRPAALSTEPAPDLEQDR